MTAINVHNGQSLVTEPDVSPADLSGVIRATMLDPGQHFPAELDIYFADRGDDSTHSAWTPP
jgi:hypothetical protein